MHMYDYKDIERVLEKFKGVKFLHNGRSIEEGLDCLGFVVLFYREFGIDLPDNDGRYIQEDWYVTEPDRYIKNIKKLNGKKVEHYKDLRALDLVYFAISRNIITHSGVMISKNRFAHMSPKKNFIISKMERHWLSRCRGAVRFDIPFIYD